MPPPDPGGLRAAPDYTGRVPPGQPASRICFVTGVSGFLGANLAPLLARRYRLRVLVRPGQEVPALLGIDHERIEGDLLTPGALRRGVEGAEAVVHLAALVSFRPEDRAAMIAINGSVPAALAAMAREAGVRRLLHVSSVSTIGFSDEPRELDETATYNFDPLRIGYCRSKKLGEDAVLAECRKGLDAVVVNPTSMFGAGDRRKARGSLIDSLLAGRVRWAPPGGIGVADVARVAAGCVLALERGRPGERYILGGENLSALDLMRRIARIAGTRAPLRTTPRSVILAAERILRWKERAFGSRLPLTSEILRLSTRFLWYSSAKARRELGYEAGDVDGGIAAAVAWMKSRR
ncbi:MAG: SDR family oxidoreductase [Planctomycetota bacterium]